LYETSKRNLFLNKLDRRIDVVISTKELSYKALLSAHSKNSSFLILNGLPG
jgi:hypothetical protein